jgi:hypothetical protein
MRSLSIGSISKFAVLMLAIVALSACHRGVTKPNPVQAENIPSSFDVTLLADKDNQFDFEGAPLSSQDLESAFRYRQEQSLPMATVLLKRGEKEKVKNEQIVALARIAYQMKFKAYLLNRNGEISEVQAQTKGAPEPTPPQGEGRKKP